MKKIYFLMLLLATTVGAMRSAAQGSTQCSINKLGLEVLNVVPSGTGGCIATANVYFVANVSNTDLKFFTFHAWDRVGYPSLTYTPGSAAPTAAGLGSVLRTIVIEKDVNAPTGWKLSSTYPDNNVAINNSGITLRAYTVPQNAGGLYEGFKEFVFFELQGVTITSQVACTNVDLAVDIWSSTSEQNQLVSCANKSLTIFSCLPESNPIITATINCNPPRAYSATFNNAGGCKPFFVNYQVYLNQNGNDTRDETDPLVNGGDADGDGQSDNWEVIFPGETVTTALRLVTNLQQQVLFLTATAYTFELGGAVQTIPFAQQVIGNDCSVLPVTLKSFAANRNSNNKQEVDLTWETAMELNNKGFYVQRNSGSGWKMLGFVPSAAGASGNSSNPLKYKFKDQNTESGISQYRLVQEDHDGKTAFSETKAISGIKGFAGVMIFPNPATDGKFNILFGEDGAKEVMIINLNGQIVKQFRNLTQNSLTVTGLSSGIYTLKITNIKAGNVQSEKVVVK